MRYIGSKLALLENIESVIRENAAGGEETFCDLFSGTATVARQFKKKYRILSNDFLYFSYVLQKAVIENNHVPFFARLKRIGIQDPFKFLEESPCHEVGERYFVTRHYAPYGDCRRMYLSTKNAVRIDFIRTTIEAWKNENLLTDAEYFYLLAGLIEGVPYVSNIAGTYGAYLKSWDKRAYKDFEMIRLDIEDNGRENRCYNRDADELITEIGGDILYLDPPYNSRQYAPNYHLLETIARYDEPEIKGVSGIRRYDEQKSAFCVRKEATRAFEAVIEKADFEQIILSYSSEGLMQPDEIEKILKAHGIAKTYKRYDIPYRKYKSKKSQEEKTLCEYLFYIKKERKQGKKSYSLVAENPLCYTAPPSKIQNDKSKKYVKSPLNYIGGKYKLLPQLLPLFPTDIHTFVDLFCGGANVGINVNADQVICNDINTKIIELFTTFKREPLEAILARIDDNIAKFQLSKTNEEGFIRFRDHYNENPDPIDLYTLACYSFNYQFRFNNRHEYNNPFGRNRSHFSQRMRENLIAFVNRMKERKIEFISKDFTDVDLSFLGPQDFVYCDPPYFITTGSYNDGNRGFKDWRAKEEKALYALLDSLHERNIRFALSNVLTHKGQVNAMLMEWSRKYHVIHLQNDYANANYHTKRGGSDEVLITNDEHLIKAHD